MAVAHPRWFQRGAPPAFRDTAKPKGARLAPNSPNYYVSHNDQSSSYQSFILDWQGKPALTSGWSQSGKNIPKKRPLPSEKTIVGQR